jgi:hypothetical protein
MTFAYGARGSRLNGAGAGRNQTDLTTDDTDDTDDTNDTNDTNRKHP